MKFDKALEIVRQDHGIMRRSNWPKTIWLIWIDMNPPDGSGLYVQFKDICVRYHITAADLFSEWQATREIA